MELQRRLEQSEGCEYKRLFYYFIYLRIVHKLRNDTHFSANDKNLIEIWLFLELFYLWTNPTDKFDKR